MNMEEKKPLCVLRGDGIDKDIVNSALKVLETVASKYNLEFEYEFYDIGYNAYLKTESCYPDLTREAILNSKAVLLGAVGDPRANMLAFEKRPEKALLEMRKDLDLYANIRVMPFYISLKDCWLIKNGPIDNYYSYVCREFGQGIYYGNHKLEKDYAEDTMFYDKNQISKIIDYSIDLTEKNKLKLSLIDKANVLACSLLWRNIFDEKVSKYNICTNRYYIDFATAKCLIDLEEMGVIVTSNMFGDIIADEIAACGGSLGLAASYSIGSKGQFFYEPIHGSAPNLKNTDRMNPTGTILSAAYYFEHFYDREDLKELIFEAIERFYESYTSFDLNNGKEAKTCSEMTNIICDYIISK